MPGVANSTMKCPNFGDFVFAIALRASSAIVFLPDLPGASPVRFRVPIVPLFGPLADEFADADVLLTTRPALAASKRA